MKGEFFTIGVAWYQTMQINTRNYIRDCYVKSSIKKGHLFSANIGGWGCNVLHFERKF